MYDFIGEQAVEEEDHRAKLCWKRFVEGESIRKGRTGGRRIDQSRSCDDNYFRKREEQSQILSNDVFVCAHYGQKEAYLTTLIVS